jgi:hypothetical protein
MRWGAALELNFADFDDSLDLHPDVTIGEVLLLQEQLRVLPPQRRVVHTNLQPKTPTKLVKTGLVWFTMIGLP